MKNKALAAVVIALVGAGTASAQIGNYLGPGVLTRGAGTVGQRGGQGVNLRFGGQVSAFYDNGLVPLSGTANGIADLGGSGGIEAGLFAFGTHQWKKAQLGLDYSGNFRHYLEHAATDNTDQMLTLGYTYQKTQRLTFDLRESAGTVSRGNSGFGGIANGLPTDAIDPNSLLLFDSRTSYLQSGMDVSYLTSPRMMFRMGGQGFVVERASKALIGVRGYALQGSILRRISRETTVGVTFLHSHYDFPRAFGESDINSYQGMWSRSLGRNWEVAAQGGVFQVEAQGTERISFEPAIAAILGISSGVQTFYRKSLFPQGDVRLTRRFKTASLNLHYARSFNPGNGVYQTSRGEVAEVTYSYQGIRKLSLSLLGGFIKQNGIGQATGTYRIVTGGAGVTYSLTPALGIFTRYDARDQQADLTGFARTSYRVSFGLSFSPGSIPVTLW